MQNEKNDKKKPGPFWISGMEVALFWIIMIVAVVVYQFGGEAIAGAIMFFGFVELILGKVGMIVFGFATNKDYMRKQKADNTDKKKLLDLMAEVMGDRYKNYTYVTGFFEKTEMGGKIWFYSYVLAFNQTDMVILSFIVEQGQVILIDRMPVDWNEATVKYHFYNDDINLEFMLGSEQITIYVRKVIKSDGAENSSKPLAVFQEKEAELLKSYLPGYPNAIKS